jgi:hypothetical protein
VLKKNGNIVLVDTRISHKVNIQFRKNKESHDVESKILGYEDGNTKQ